MTSKVFIRGKSEPVELSEEQARTLDKKMRDPMQRRDEVISITKNGVPFLTLKIGEIKMVIVDQPVQSDNSGVEALKKWSKWREGFYRLSLTEKVEEVMRGMGLMVLSLIQSPAYIDGGVRKDVDRQLRGDLGKFFEMEENKYRTLPDVGVFLRHLPANHAKGRTGEKYGLRGLSYLGLAISSDRQASKERWAYVEKVRKDQTGPTPEYAQ